MSELTNNAIVEKTLLLDLYSSGKFVGLNDKLQENLNFVYEMDGKCRKHIDREASALRSAGFIGFLRASYISLLLAAQSVGIKADDSALIMSIEFYVREITKIPHDGTVRVDLLKRANETLLERLCRS